MYSYFGPVSSMFTRVIELKDLYGEGGQRGRGHTRNKYVCTCTCGNEIIKFLARPQTSACRFLYTAAFRHASTRLHCKE